MLVSNDEKRTIPKKFEFLAIEVAEEYIIINRVGMAAIKRRKPPKYDG